MSYQIKQTPFFQRMLSTSKKNGQLAKLKEEYERIKDFNDHTIDMKMRQVRLKRLFREIEEIKDSSISISTATQTKRRRLGNDRIRSSEAMRMEAFIRAKELGKEYSKLNAHMDRSTHVVRTDTLSPGNISSPMKLEQERRARSTKRITYGNEISRSNVERIALRPRKKKTLKRDLFNVSSIDVEKKEKLLQRLNYGNSRSSINMSKIPKRHTKHKIATEVMDIKKSEAKLPAGNSASSSEQEREQKVTRFNVASKDTQILQTFEELKSSKIRVIVASASDLEKDAEQRMRAKQRWHNISLTIRHRFDAPRLRRFQQSLNMCAEHDHILRMISNEIHLPECRLPDDVNPEPASQPEGLVTDTDEADDYDDANDDMLYNGETLTLCDNLASKTQSKTFKPPLSADLMLRTSQFEHYEQEYELLPPPSASLLIKDTTSNSQNALAPVEKYAQMFMPHVPGVPPKEVEEFSVQKLRHIFENQSE